MHERCYAEVVVRFSTPMNTLSRLLKASAALLVVAAAAQSYAATVYSSRNAWESVTPGFTNLDFESYAGNGAHVGDFSDTGIAFDAKATYGDDAYLFTGGPSSGYDIGSGKWMIGGFSSPGSYSRYLDITVPGTYDSFGLDVSTYANAGFISVFASTSLGSFGQIVATPDEGSSFLGFTLGAGETLNYLRVENVADFAGNTGNDNLIFDNFSFGNVGSSSVPDGGSTFGLLALALAAFATARSRARARAQG